MKRRTIIVLALLTAVGGFAWGVAAARGAFPHDLIASATGHRNPQLIARRDYFAARHGPADIVFVGDSIFRSIEWGEEFPGLRVANRAIEGDTTQDVLGRIGPIAELNAKQYVIMLGTNDRLRAVPIETTARNMQRIVEALPGKKLIMAVTPCAPGCDQASIDRLNALLATTKGARFGRTTVDARELADNVHPNARSMAELVRDVRHQLTLRETSRQIEPL